MSTGDRSAGIRSVGQGPGWAGMQCGRHGTERLVPEASAGGQVEGPQRNGGERTSPPSGGHAGAKEGMAGAPTRCSLRPRLFPAPCVSITASPKQARSCYSHPVDTGGCWGMGRFELKATCLEVSAGARAPDLHCALCREPRGAAVRTHAAQAPQDRGLTSMATTGADGGRWRQFHIISANSVRRSEVLGFNALPSVWPCLSLWREMG